MNHPPIPPNCSCFEERGVMLFRFHHDINRHSKYVDWAVGGPLHGDMKIIIAAVARCAWLDEMDGRLDMSHHVRAFSGDMTPEEKQKYDHNCKCKENADAWKEWGLQK